MLCSALFATVLAAASQVGFDEEIVVTADFRATSADQLPISVSVIQPDQRGDAVNHLQEILGQIPNVHFSSGASRGRYFQIRGIGERAQFSEPLNSSVGLIVDGVDLSGVGGAATLFDVGQVEVLRGPQGTLYGANALAGLINITTPDPTLEHSARLYLEGGDYNAFGAGAVVSGPLSKNAAAGTGYRIAVQQYRDDGFMDNDFLNRDDTNEHDELTARAKLVWGDEQQRWRLNFGRIDADNGYDAFSLDNNRTTLSDQPGHDEQLTEYVALSFERDFAEVRLEASVAGSNTQVSYGYDEDWAYTGFDPIGYTSFDLYERTRKNRTVDVRLLSQPGMGLADGTWDWVVGVYRLQQDVDFARIYTFAGPFSSEFDTQRTALYGEVTRALGERWRLSVGGRFERHSGDYQDSAGVMFDPDENLFGGRVLLERSLDGGNLLYLGITQGYKTGGFNQDGSLPASLRDYDEETLWNVELGYKAKLVDERLRLRAAVFRMQREDIQLQTSQIIPVPGSPVGDFVVFRSNAAEGFNQGLELETEFLASERLTLFANVAWLDSEYDDFVNASGDFTADREQAHAPGYQFFVGAQLDFTERWSLRVEWEGKDEFYFSDSHNVKAGSYELLNASINYRGERWTARLWGRNLTDEEYQVRGFLFGNDPRDFYTTRPFTQLGEPSRIGLSLSLEI